ncbi:AI-2E family transporter [Candidatus Parcubacteria bacterium]|nr:MAG: AI-2E family transporter [Candidatus Parcubacteria bacterium]
MPVERKSETIFFLALLIAVLGAALLIVAPYLNVIALAAMFAVVGRPLHRRILSLFPNWEGVAAFFSVAVILVVLLVPLSFFGVRIVQEAGVLYGALSGGGGEGVMEALEVAIRRYALEPIFGTLPSTWSFDDTFLVDSRKYVEEFLGWVVGNVGAVFSGIARVTFNLFLGFIALYYFFKDGVKLVHKAEKYLPLRSGFAHEIMETLDIAINSVIRGSMVVAAIQGLLVGIGFLIFGVPSPALWGLVGVIASLIPSVGTAVVIVPGVLYLFVSGSTGAAIGLLVWGLIIVGLVDNFLRPYLIERDVKIHPFLVLLSVLGGIRFFGLAGFLLGPLVLSLLFALIHMLPSVALSENRSHSDR